MLTFWNIGSVQKCLTDIFLKLKMKKHNKTRGWVEGIKVFKLFKMGFLAFPLGDPKLRKEVSLGTIFKSMNLENDRDSCCTNSCTLSTADTLSRTYIH